MSSTVPTQIDLPEKVACRCGRAPEENTSLRGYRCSLSCKCGGDEINFVTRSDTKQKMVDNWRSLIKREPYKHYVHHLPEPESDVPMFRGGGIGGDDSYDPCPLRRHVRATGGHCSGGAGPC